MEPVTQPGSEQKSCSAEPQNNISNLQSKLEKRTSYIKRLQRNYECLSAAFRRTQQQLSETTRDLELSKISITNSTKREEDRKETESRINALLLEKENLTDDVGRLKKSLETTSVNLKVAAERASRADDKCHLLEIEMAKISEAAHHSRLLVVEAKKTAKHDSISIINKDRVIRTHAEQIESLRAEITELSQQIRQLQSNVQKANNVAYQAGIDRDNLKSEATRFRQELSKTQMRCSQFQQKLVECEEATKGLEMDLRAERLRTSSEENIRALKESNSLQQAAYNRCDELSSALEELRSKHERTSATLSELAHENKQLVKQIGSLKKNCRQNEDNLVQLSDAKAEAMAACEELLAMGRKQDELLRENQDLRDTVKEVELQRSSWMNEIRDLLSESAGQQKLFQQFDEINQGLHRSQDDLRKEIAALAEERDKLRKTATMAIQREENLQKQVEELKSQLDSTRKDFQADSQQLHQEIESTVASLRSQLSDQRIELDDVRRRNWALMKRDTLTPKEVKAVRERETALNATVSKLVLAEQASEPAFTCFDCMKPFTDPVTCIPCGHSVCEKCVVQARACTQCGSGKKVTYYPNHLLGELSAKHVYRRQALQGLLQMSESFLEISTAITSPP